ncbi:MAG: hypothetical protein GY839_12020 [candidate division Zixibacteria bacterium]|nr:hypothetical protein [candidate division Zixibacteria bacterium]
MIQMLLTCFLAFSIVIISGQDCFGYKFDRDCLKKSYNSSLSNTLRSDDEFTSDQGKLINSGGYKSRELAVLIAVFPGAIIHGAGHLYLGREETFLVLAGGEVLSLWMMAYYGFEEDYNSFDDKKSNDALLGHIGVALFISTWIYDIFNSATNANDRQYSNYAVSIQPHVYNEKVIPSLKLVSSF